MDINFKELLKVKPKYWINYHSKILKDSRGTLTNGTNT